MKASIDAKNEEDYEKMKKYRVFSSILGKFIEIVEHMFHQNRNSSADNDIEDDGLSEITKSRSETMTYKSEPPQLQNQI